MMVQAYGVMVDGWLTADGMAVLMQRPDLGFPPTRVHSDLFGHAGRKFNQSTLEYIRRNDPRYVITTNGVRPESRLRLSQRSFDWRVEDPTGPLPLTLIEHLSQTPGFIMAALGDGMDAFLENTTDRELLEKHGRPTAGLPLRDGPFGPEIDTSHNVGRANVREEVGMMLWAASIMWFGELAFERFDRDRLLTCPVGSVTETANGVIRVDLFELGESEQSIRQKQASFRDWMHYDELEERIPELLIGGSKDPMILLEYGDFPHGGVTRLTRFLDHNGRVVRRSKATSKREAELDPNNNLVWTEVVAM